MSEFPELIARMNDRAVPSTDDIGEQPITKIIRTEKINDSNE